MTKRRTTVVQQIKECTLCPELVENRNKPVIGSGPIPCKIVFLGEAPGQREDETGVPFCGTTGMVLEATARRVGLQRKDDYHLLNTLKCRPPQNTNPTSTQMKNCAPYLQAQLKVIKPRVVVALGKFAQAFVLGLPPSRIGVVRNMGKVIETPAYYAVLSCHPRFTSKGPEILQAFQTHLTIAKNIAKGAIPICTALNAF